MVLDTRSGNGVVEDDVFDSLTIEQSDALSAGTRIMVRPLNMRAIVVRIQGIVPYVQLRFSEKARAAIRSKMESGTRVTANNREARKYSAEYEAAMYETNDGKRGIPAPAFRNAMIDACRLVGFPMTKARCSIFVLAEDVDKFDTTPLILIEGEHEQYEAMVRNATGVVDMRVRSMWRQWTATLTIRFDADQFGPDDIVNLLSRAGQQIGVGEGRPFSKKSNGVGFGQFEIVPSDDTNVTEAR